MNELYFDCQAGISGDMTVAALIDIGLPLSLLKKELLKLGLIGYSISCSDVMRNGISGKKFNVKVGKQPLRDYHTIKKLISKSDLNVSVKKLALKIFSNIASAEGKIHATDHVHFHEVGAVDSIIDIVAVAIGIDYLKVNKCYCSKISLGSGFTNSMHGKIMLPAPATAEILKGFPVRMFELESELTTPTGAAIVKTLCKPGKPDQYSKIGYGAGSKTLEIPNILRVFVCDTIFDDTIDVIETNIDDMNPQFFEIVFEKLFKAGALDVFIQNIIMKKGRPAFCLTALCESKNTQKLSDIILTNTTSFGVRVRTEDRITLQREMGEVKLKGHKISVKTGYLNNKIIKKSYEYDDLKRVAAKLKKSVFDILKLLK